MRMTDVIAKKRDGRALNEAEIAFFVRGAADGTLPDYQVAAMLMAIYLRGLNDAETTALTLEMARSGEQLDLSALGPRTVDKHSTGGIGDKTTLVVAPAAAALGCIVAKMSGRGLGHTGGTVDKLESIPGFRTVLSPEEFMHNAGTLGLCVIGHSGDLAPADRRLYALRDVTATVDCLPLIASSIMSKKLAAGAKNLVLDVKCGSGAFMKTPADAQALAEKMVAIGKNAGRRVAAVITDMDVPLGHAVGNALEVAEAVEVLHGKGPADLTEVCVELAGEMVQLCTGEPPEACRDGVRRVLRDGTALERLCAMTAAQGGDAACIREPARLPQAAASLPVIMPADGFIVSMNSDAVGEASVISGAGREKKDDRIDPAAGLILLKKTGDFVRKGETAAVVYGQPERLPDAAEMLSSAYHIGAEKPAAKPLIYRVIR